jgi:hypothetical protein
VPLDLRGLQGMVNSAKAKMPRRHRKDTH